MHRSPVRFRRAAQNHKTYNMKHKTRDIKTRVFIISSFLVVVVLLAGCSNNVQESNNLNVNVNASKTSAVNINSSNQTKMDYVAKYDGAVIKTNQGDIKVEFYNQESPVTVNNFLKLADEKFYDDTKFHRVIKDFMIQGGDPNSKDDDWSNDGMGGPGYTFKDEFNKHPLVNGSLAMANSGPNTNGSQFFIVTAAATPWLDGKHTNFGEVTEGMDVVNKITQVKVNENDHPTEDVTILGVEFLEKQ